LRLGICAFLLAGMVFEAVGLSFLGLSISVLVGMVLKSTWVSFSAIDSKVIIKYGIGLALLGSLVAVVDYSVFLAKFLGSLFCCYTNIKVSYVQWKKIRKTL